MNGGIIIKRFLLDTNSLSIFSGQWNDPKLNRKLTEFIINGLFDQDKFFYITPFSYFEMMRNTKDLSEKELENIAICTDRNLQKSNIKIITNKFVYDLVDYISQFRLEVINYSYLMKNLHVKITNKVSSMLYTLVYMYLCFHISTLALLSAKDINEEQLKEKYSNLAKALTSNEYDNNLKLKCSELVSEIYPNKKSKNKINMIIIDSLKRLGLEGKEANIINESHINKIKDKHDYNITINLIIREFQHIKKVLPLKIYNFEIPFAYLIEKLIKLNWQIELNDFVDLYNLCLISSDLSIITHDKKWFEFLGSLQEDYPCLMESYEICKELFFKDC